MRKILNMTLIIFVFFALAEAARADSDGVTARFQEYIDFIKYFCQQDFPNDQAKWTACGEQRYDAMKAFHEKLFKYRDADGVQSPTFNKGIACLKEASPIVNEPDREMAIERADWIKANTCYEAALNKR